MSIATSKVEYFKQQKKIDTSVSERTNLAFNAIEELQCAIARANVLQRRNIFLEKIPLVGRYRENLDLVPFYNPDIPRLLEFFQQILYSTSAILYNHQTTIKDDFDPKIISLLEKYRLKWIDYEKTTNNITTANLVTLNEIRVKSKQVGLAYQKWIDITIFKAEIMGRVERQKQLYRAMVEILVYATHYERHLIAKKKYLESTQSKP